MPAGEPPLAGFWTGVPSTHTHISGAKATAAERTNSTALTSANRLQVVLPEPRLVLGGDNGFRKADYRYSGGGPTSCPKRQLGLWGSF